MKKTAPVGAVFPVYICVSGSLSSQSGMHRLPYLAMLSDSAT